MSIVKVQGLNAEYFQSGAGPDIVLLHSLLTDASVFEPMLPSLSAGRRVTCLNLPGFGRSDARPLETVAAYAEHVVATVDALALPREAALFGNGFGAFVALQAAARHGGRFGKLIVADVVPAFPEPARAPFLAMAARVRESGMPAVLDTAIARMLPPAFQERHPEHVAQRKRRLAEVDAHGFARACLALAALDLRPELGAIRNPALVMCGALDQTTPPALAREVAQAIPGAEYRDIPDSGHCPMLEQPDFLCEAMAGFLRRATVQ